jgi:hypothetical protein
MAAREEGGLGRRQWAKVVSSYACAERVGMIRAWSASTGGVRGGGSGAVGHCWAADLCRSDE